MATMSTTGYPRNGNSRITIGSSHDCGDRSHRIRMENAQGTMDEEYLFWDDAYLKQLGIGD